MPLLTCCRLERSLHIIEHAVPIEATALEVAIVVVCDRYDLLGGLHLLNHFKVGSVEDLDVSLVKSYHDETIIAKSVHHLEFARHFLFQFELVGGEEVYLHLLILADNRVDTDKLDELGGCVEGVFVDREPVVIKVGLLLSNR